MNWYSTAGFASQLQILDGAALVIVNPDEGADDASISAESTEE